MEGKLKVPEGVGKRMWDIMIKLLAEQEGVEIQYTIVPKESVDENTDSDKTA